MGFKRVAIIGVNCISVSLALGLKAQAEPPEIVGSDADAALARKARSLGAFDRQEHRADQVCRDADLVIVSTPLSAVRETFAAIAPYLQSGCLVTDTAPLKTPVLRWAAELLPEHVSFVGGHIIPNPAVVGFDHPEALDAAGADLLKNALYCLTTSPQTSGTAVNRLAALAGALEAQTLLMDATEHDGLQAGIEGLPDLLAVALLHATVDTPGWREMRKFAALRFAVATHNAADAYERRDTLYLNRENVLLRLDGLLNELIRLRDLLADGDEEALAGTFAAAAEGRGRWIAEREQGMWVKELGIADTSRLPSPTERFLQMLFGSAAGRRAKKPERSLNT